MYYLCVCVLNMSVVRKEEFIKASANIKQMEQFHKIKRGPSRAAYLWWKKRSQPKNSSRRIPNEKSTKTSSQKRFNAQFAP